MPREFVFVHGMSHGAWCWELVQARLERAGHRTLAVDLPGHGRRAHEWRRASVGAYARAVADAMSQAGSSRAVVVGHSMGGIVIPKVAELVPERVAHPVFPAAAAPAVDRACGHARLLRDARAADLRALPAGRRDLPGAGGRVRGAALCPGRGPRHGARTDALRARRAGGDPPEVLIVTRTEPP